MMGRTARGWTGGVLAAVLVLTGLGLLAVAGGRSIARSGGSGWFDDYRTGRTTGTVLDVDDDMDARGIDVSYTVGGRSEVAFVWVDAGVLPKVGDRVELAYDPSWVEDVALVGSPGPSAGQDPAAPGPAAAGGSQLGWVVAGLLVLLAGVAAGVLTGLWVRRAPRPAPPWRQPLEAEPGAYAQPPYAQAPYAQPPYAQATAQAPMPGPPNDGQGWQRP